MGQLERALRHQQRLGVVSQDTFLLNASLAENIAFGTPGADLTAVEAAAASALALGFIRDLPEGFDTVVGERGYRLSTIVAADQILVLQAGRIIERGHRRGLLASGGACSRLWNQQLEGAVAL